MTASDESESQTPNLEYTPRVIHPLKETFVSYTPEPFFDSYRPKVPIAIDFGTANVRAGLTNQKSPFMNYPSVISRHRDRRVAKTFTFVGKDCYLDPSYKSSVKTPFDGPFITNWDYAEWMLDYTFSHLGVDSQGGVDNPIIMNERMATPYSQRANMYQLLFEAYNAPSVAFGISDLFSFHYNNRNSKNKSGLVIGCGNESTDVIPVFDSKPLLQYAKRINWGGEQAVEYLSKSIGLKYPFFPSKIHNQQFEYMIHDYCYFSDDYPKELEKLMDLDYLQKKDITIEVPFTEVIQQQKTDEELAKQLEKRKEQGKRLQEQAQKMRLEKLVEKEADYQYYSDIKERLFNPNNHVSRKQILHTLNQAGFDDEADFNKYLTSLEKSLKRARHQDIGDDEPDAVVPVFDLLDIKDEELTEEQLKTKKTQKMHKANFEARKKAKEEKLIEQKRKEEEEAKEQEWREKDLQGWINEKRLQLKEIVDLKKQRKKLKDELNDRKSHAAQMRMKNIANLAAEGGSITKSISSTSLNNTTNNAARTKRSIKKVTIDNDPNDTFGANDDDWMIYRDIGNVEDEDLLEIEDNKLKNLEEVLLKYDPNFNLEDLFNSEYNWKKSTVHKFLRGAYPYVHEDQHHQHQIHLNVERIKIPEVYIQPNIAGLDQTGLIELSENLLIKRLPSANFYEINDKNPSPDIIKNIFLTGGCSKISNFKNRIVKEFTSFLPVDSDLQAKVAEDPINDAWKGMKIWSTSEEFKNSLVTKREYEEMGADYIKEHNLGNVRI